MITGSFLIEWAIRSSVLIGSGAVLLWLLRVKDPSIRLAACIAVVCGSLAMPLFTAALPKLPVAIPQAPVAARLDRIPQRGLCFQSNDQARARQRRSGAED